jgi:hypothetical protein
MLSASVISIGQLPASNSLTTWTLTIVMPLSSVFPVLLLHLAASDTLRRSKGKLILWAAIVVLIIVLLARSLSFLHPDRVYTPNVSLREGLCIGPASFKPMVIFSWTVAGLLALGISIYICGSGFPIFRHRANPFAILLLFIS